MFPHTLAHWCSMYLCWQSIDSVTRVLPIGGGKKQRWKKLMILEMKNNAHGKTSERLIGSQETYMIRLVDFQPRKKVDASIMDYIVYWRWRCARWDCFNLQSRSYFTVIFHIKTFLPTLTEHVRMSSVLLSPKYVITYNIGSFTGTTKYALEQQNRHVVNILT